MRGKEHSESQFSGNELSRKEIQHMLHKDGQALSVCSCFTGQSTKGRLSLAASLSSDFTKHLGTKLPSVYVSKLAPTAPGDQVH